MPGPARAASLGSYRVFETQQFQKDLQALAKSGQRRLVERLERSVYLELREHPHFGPNIKRLKDYTPKTWRYRIGAWRFFYEIDDANGIVFMTAASHRGSAY